jgi:hypothetical protein
MGKTFRASKLMALAVMFGVTALGATVAHAEAGSHWNINGKGTTAELKAQLQATLENNHGILLTKVGLSTVEILCTSLKFVNTFLSTTGSATGKIHFEGCVFKGNGSILFPCKPHSPGAVEGLIETDALKALIVLHTPGGGAAEPVVELAPASGVRFATLVLGKEVGSECAIVFAKAEITGKLILKDCQKEGTVEKVTHLAEEEKTLSALLFFGNNKATLDGSANVSLTGAHTGFKFSDIAG